MAERQSSVIMTATVASITVQPSAGNGYMTGHVTLDVDTLWRGNVTRTSFIEAALPESSDCGFDFQVGRKYLIYVSRTKNWPLTIDACNYMTQRIERKKADLAILGPG